MRPVERPKPIERQAATQYCFLKDYCKTADTQCSTGKNVCIVFVINEKTAKDNFQTNSALILIIPRL